MLAHLGIFSGLPREELTTLTSRAAVRFFPKNTVILNEGDESDSLHVIDYGRVKVFVSDTQGREFVLGTHGPGEHFGELAMFDGDPQAASVRTLEDSRVCILRRDQFHECLERHPDISRQVMRDLAHRARAATAQVRDLALLDVYGRVARVLLDLAEQKDGQLIIVDPITHQEIASRVGASREMVSRIMKVLRDGGFIRLTERHIVIERDLPERP